MRIDSPTCGFKPCRYCFDGNYTNKVEYDRCEYSEYKDSLVRCKDCKYHDEGENYIYCWALKMKCPNDSEFFCKYGELEG